MVAVKYAVKGINHTSNDVRMPAYDCMGELYRMMGGNEISKYYDGLRQAQLDALMTKFAELDDEGVPTKLAKKQSSVQQPKQQEQVIETNIGKPAAKKAGAQQRKPQAP